MSAAPGTPAAFAAALSARERLIGGTELADGRLALVHNHSCAADAVARRVSLYDEIDDEGVTGTAATPSETAPTGDASWGAPRAPLSPALSAATAAPGRTATISMPATATASPTTPVTASTADWKGDDLAVVSAYYSLDTGRVEVLTGAPSA